MASRGAACGVFDARPIEPPLFATSRRQSMPGVMAATPCAPYRRQSRPKEATSSRPFPFQTPWRLTPSGFLSKGDAMRH